MTEIALPRIVTIDGGPSTGKTSVSTLLADRLGYQKLTTGMFLCSFGAAIRRESLERADRATIATFITEASTLYDLSDSHAPSVSINGIDISGSIFTSANKEYASKLGRIAEARQRVGADVSSLTAEGRWVIDRGQDQIPSPDAKFWLQASPEVRAIRRCAQMAVGASSNSVLPPYSEVLSDILRREAQDASNPLYEYHAQHDSTVIDTTHLSLEQTYTRITDSLTVPRS